MGILSGVQQSDNVQEAKDVIGGGYSVLPSNIYKGVVKFAYVHTADSGAKAVQIGLINEDGKEIRQAIYFCSGDAKGNKTYYTKDGEDHPLPGYTLSNELALLTTGYDLGNLDTERKYAQVWDSESGGLVDREVDMIVDMLDKEVYVAVLNNLEFKSIKTETGYVDSDETRESNEIVKAFDIEGKRTVNEIQKDAKEGVFFDQWLTQWEGVQRDRTKGKKAAGGASGAPAIGGAGQKKAPGSLFKNKK